MLKRLFSYKISFIICERIRDYLTVMDNSKLKTHSEWFGKIDFANYWLLTHKSQEKCLNIKSVIGIYSIEYFT